MVFDISGKVALITGGASGLGLSHAKELLRNGLKGVTIADVNEANGRKAIVELNDEFGKKTAIFVRTDVTVEDEFTAAFEKTIGVFGNLDILINSAGIVNDTMWKKEIDLNLLILSKKMSGVEILNDGDFGPDESEISIHFLTSLTPIFSRIETGTGHKNATINGTFLGMENYLKDYKQGAEAVIVNTSSIAGLRGNSAIPVYAGTKFAIMGMTSSWGNTYHFERTGVRVVTICPGVTDTPILKTRRSTYSPAYIGAWSYSIDENLAKSSLSQKPEAVSRELVRILKYAQNGTVWVVELSEPAYEFKMPPREDFKGNILQETE